MAKKSILVGAALLLSGLSAGWTDTARAQDHRNPVDAVSNPEALNFTNVIVGVQDLTERFQRDGQVHEPPYFSAIRPGMTQADIRQLLGQPLAQFNSTPREWNYNYKFQLPQSGNYLVCQYKVVFGEDQLVRETVWRRHQCQDLSRE